MESERDADVAKAVLSLQQNKHIPPELRGVPDHQLVQALGGYTCLLHTTYYKINASPGWLHNAHCTIN